MVNFLNGKRNVDYQMHTRLWIALQVGCIYYFQCADKIQNSLLIHKLKVIKPGYWCQKWHHINYWFSITGVGHCKKKKSRIFFFIFLYVLETMSFQCAFCIKLCSSCINIRHFILGARCFYRKKWSYFPRLCWKLCKARHILYLFICHELLSFY